MVDPSYHPGLLRDDLHAAVCTFAVTQEMLIGNRIFPIGELFPLAPFYIFGDRPGFFLGDAGQQRDQKLSLAIHGIDIFLFKEYFHIGGLQLPNGVQSIHSVPGEPGDGLGHDQIDIPGQGIGDHPVECLPAIDGDAGDALVRIHIHEDPVRPLADQLGEIVLLSRHAVQLLVGSGGHTGIGCHTALFAPLNRSAAGIAGGWYIRFTFRSSMARPPPDCK